MQHSCSIAKPGILAIYLERLVAEGHPGLLEWNQVSGVPPARRRGRVFFRLFAHDMVSDGAEYAVGTDNGIEFGVCAVFESDCDSGFCLFDGLDALFGVEDVLR